MDRRQLLGAAGLSVLGVLAAACAQVVPGTSQAAPLPSTPPTSAVPPSSAPVSALPVSRAPSSASVRSSAAPAVRRVPALGRVTTVPPWGRVISEVPDVNESTVGLTIDDGLSSEVVGAYVELARTTGLRLTFFLNGVYDSWTDHRAALRPMVDSGQVQLGNHTWDHPDLCTISSAQIRSQVERNDRFLQDNYGVDSRPWFRPPYFSHDKRTDQVLADLGYSELVWWTGSFGDANELRKEAVLANADTYLKDTLIVIGHANFGGVVPVMDAIIGILAERKLRTVTLNDVFQV
jgi:peptidoglycan-N-acetylglucosamine deacetylase